MSVFGEPIRTHLGKDLAQMRFYSKDWFWALWQGERPLWEAWWVLGGSMFVVLFLIPVLFNPALIHALSIVFSSFALFGQCFLWVSVWRCAPNVHSVFWLILARFMVVGGVCIAINNMFF